MSKRKDKNNYIKNWAKQIRKPMADNDILMFGKHRLKTITEVKILDPEYYKWLCKTFKITTALTKLKELIS
jgi:hypothetical protein